VADNVGYTPGTGETIATDDVGGNQFQRIKLTDGTPDSAQYIPGDQANGLDVDVTRVQGSVTVAQTTASNLKVDASSVPVPVTDGGGSLTVDGAVSVTGSVVASGTVAANQGSPNTNANGWPVKLADGANAANLTNVGGQYALKVDVVQDVGISAQTDKSSFTEGTGRIGVNGGILNESIASDPAEDQAAAFRITPKRGQHVNLRRNDGTEIGTASAPVRVDPVGTTAQPVSGTVAATLSGSTNAGAAAKIINGNPSGTENVTAMAIALPKSGGAVAGGTASDPIRTDPTGTTAQPVSGTVTANQGGAPWAQNLTQVGGQAVVTGANGLQRVGIVDEAGAVFSESNPLPVAIVPSEGTRWKAAATFTASQTDIALYTPGSGKRIMLEGLIITPTAAGALIKIYDQTNAGANMLYQGQPPLGSIVITPAKPVPFSAVNNILRYSTGGSAAGDITAWGYEV
jgi:hypothetical protein